MSREQNLKDRKLGHEWYGWDGDVDAHEAFIDEPKRLFLGVVFLAFSAVFCAGALLLWAVYPRLVWIHPLVGQAFAALFVAAWLAFLGMFGVLCLSLKAHRPMRAAEFICDRLFRLFPLLSRVSEWLNISKDRLGYSLIETHNELMRIRMRSSSNGRILCLAPRCLEKENLSQVKALMTEYDVDFYIVGTGAGARQRVAELKPAAIIAIACERDLVTGIREVGYRIPVIGVANKRPLGPCKGAYIELCELRDAIGVFKRRLEFPAAGTAEENAAGDGLWKCTKTAEDDPR